MWLIGYILGTFVFWGLFNWYERPVDDAEKVMGAMIWPILLLCGICAFPYIWLAERLETLKKEVKEDVGTDNNTSV